MSGGALAAGLEGEGPAAAAGEAAAGEGEAAGEAAAAAAVLLRLAGDVLAGVVLGARLLVGEDLVGGGDLRELLGQGVALGVGLEGTLLEELSICNVMGLLRVAHSTALDWRTLLQISPGDPLRRSHRRGTTVSNAASTISLKFSRDSFGVGTSSFKAEVHLSAPAETVFEHVSKLERRLQWDCLMGQGCKIHQQIDETNSLLYLVMKPIMLGQRAHDYVLLQSTRKDEKDGYIVASRSVITGELPPVAGLNRGAVLPSGFVVSPAGDRSSCVLTYVVQMPPLKGISGSFQKSVLAKVSSAMVQRFVRLQCLLEKPASPVASSTHLVNPATALNDQL